MQNGNLMFKMRIKLGMTQKDVANYLNISLTAYKLYEACIRPMKLNELNMLSNLFKISLNNLLELSDKISFFDIANIDYKYLKFSMRYVRRINRVSQKQLANELNVSVPTVSKFENHPEEMNACYIRSFALRFSVSIDYICGKTMKKEVL